MRKKQKNRKKKMINSRRAQIRIMGKHMLVLCNKGHLLESHKLNRNFAGSVLQSELTFRHVGDRFDRLARACRGYGHNIERVLGTKKKQRIQKQLFG